jgi:TolA-binding protein
MLKRNIAKEPQSVRHYMDMGQYLYRSREVLDSAKYFAKALEIAAVPVEFGPDVSPAEQAIENDQHAKEREKLNFVINDKEQTPSKDRQEFTRIIEATREMLNNSATNFKSWDWIRDQALHYANQGKLDQAQQLLLKHIETVKDNAKLEQAYVLLLDTQLQMKRMDLSHDTFLKIANAYALRPELLRQAGHALYSKQGAFEEPDRADVLKMSETLFRSAIAVSRKFNELEMAGQCSFELGNVLCYQERTELAAGVYRDSIDLTKAVTAKEDRMQRLVDCLKKLKKYSDARKVLYDLSKSPRTDISTRAKQDLKALELQEPSPDNK